MPITTYDTLNGEIVGQSTGGVRTDFLTDALGNVTATVDDTGAVVNTYRYKPSGQMLAKTGVGANSKFLWNGESGSRTTGLGGSDFYNQARHYGSSHATWTTVDPLWPNEPAYVYVNGNPTTSNDPSGLAGPCSRTYNSFSSGPGSIPPANSLKGCRKRTGNGAPCDTNMPSPGMMTCLVGKERDFAQGGDVGAGQGNVLPGTIKDWCRLNLGCLPGVLGVRPGTITKGNCEKYLKDHPDAALKLAAADLACNGFATYGYSSPGWPGLFEECAKCMDGVMSRLSVDIFLHDFCGIAKKWSMPLLNCEPCLDPLRDYSRELRKGRSL